MDLLTAVNRILPKLGEHPVTSLTVKHPTLAILLPEIQTKLEDESMQGMWFNTFNVKLQPDSEGNVTLPVDTLSFVPKYLNAVQRGRQLYNGETQLYFWSEPVEGRLVTKVPFDLLPESAASLVFYSALVSVYVTDIGLEREVQLWQQQADIARARVSNEHLRNKKYTTRRSPRYQRILAAMRA